jgi:hypothetical protein
MTMMPVSRRAPALFHQPHGFRALGATAGEAPSRPPLKGTAHVKFDLRLPNQYHSQWTHHDIS